MRQTIINPQELKSVLKVWLVMASLIFGVALAGAGPAFTQYTLSKRQDFAQNGTNAPLLALNSPFLGQLQLAPAFQGAVTAATATFPDGQTLTFSVTSGIDLEIATNFADEASLDAVFPAGGYNLNFTTQGGDTKLTLNLPADNFPQPPQVANINPAQAINPASDFLLQWEPFNGAFGNDFIVLEVDDAKGSPVFSTPEILSPGFLPGSAFFGIIPSGTLQPGQTYQGSLLFFNVTTLDTNSYPGAFGGVAFISRTSFGLATTNNPTKPVYDLSQYFVTKKQAYAQTGQSSLVKDPTGPFQAWLGFFLSPAGGVASAQVFAPGETIPLAPNETFPIQWNHQDSFKTQAALDAAYPAGNYTFAFNTLNNGQEAGTVLFPSGADYPAAPQILNYSSAQSINPSLDFNLQWTPDAASGPADYVWMYIADTNGTVVFTTPFPPGAPGSPPGTNSSAVIPAGTLKPASEYEGRLQFFRAAATNSSSIPGAPGVAVFASVNSFTLATISSPSAPMITLQPSSQTNIVGANVSFAVTATGTAPLTYQWSFNGTNIAGATLPQLTLKKVQAAQAGKYSVVVSNLIGFVSSQPADLTLLVPPVITQPPQSQTVAAGAGVTFSVTASGSAPLSYQWLFNGKSISGQTNATLALAAAQSTNAGKYSVVVGNTGGTATSQAATLTVDNVPVITTQPQNASVMAGGAAGFSVTATGTGPLAYQWRFNGTNIAGATQANLSLSNVTTNQAGVYSVIVTNAVGSAPSSNAILTVTPPLTPPVITQPPQSQTVAAGTTVKFAVTATGSAPLSYQWLFNGFPMTGQSGSALVLNNVQSTNAGKYTVKVANAAGAVTSQGATLAVDAVPVITTEPQNASVAAGAPAVFSVTATGTGPLAYQWRFNGTNIAGAVQSGLSLAKVGTNQAGNYSVVVTNAVGSATSSNAVLTVTPPPTAPVITQQPLSQTVTNGAGVTFFVAASGTAPLNYQWLFNSQNVSGQTSSNLVLTNVQSVNAGKYSVKIMNAAGSVTSQPAVLTVYTAPAITAQPKSATVGVGGSLSFNVGAAGTAPLSYQWQLNGTNIPGATHAELNLVNAQSSQAGNYTVVVSNLAGFAMSQPATLTVLVPPAITQQPQNQTVTNGATVNFTVTATGSAPLSYQWLLNNKSLPGQTSSTLVLTNAQPTNAGKYSVVVTNTGGAVTSQAATLAVDTVPVITTEPQSVTVTAGAAASFSITAAGTAPLSYQWFFNGTKITGATQVNLTLTKIGANQAGNYYVVVSNAVGSAASSNAILTVTPALTPPVITQQPQSQTVTNGATVTFSIAATGSAPLAYQWLWNATPLAGQTFSSLILTNVQSTNAGKYGVVVANGAGAVNSQAATLAVDVPPAIVTQPASQSVIAGASVIFSVSASGTTPLSYQWQFDGTNIAGATKSSLTLGKVQASQAGGYSVVVSNAVGSALSQTAILTISPLVVNLAPASIAGDTLAFVIGSASAPFATNGSYDFSASTTGGVYNLTPLTTNVLFSQGSYTYTNTGPSKAAVQFTDSLLGPGVTALSFTGTNTGVYSITLPNSPGSQTGTFTLNTATTAPASISGKTVTFVIGSGSGAFAPTGDYSFVAASKGNAYSIIPLIGGIQASQGAYVYAPTSGQIGIVNFTDSNSGPGTAILTFTSPGGGVYLLTSPDAPGQQTGTFTVN